MPLSVQEVKALGLAWSGLPEAPVAWYRRVGELALERVLSLSEVEEAREALQGHAQTDSWGRVVRGERETRVA